MADTTRSGNSAPSTGGSGQSRRTPDTSGRADPGRDGHQRGGRGGGGRGGGGRGKGRGKASNKGRGGAPDPGDRVAELAGPLRTVLERLPATQRRVLEYRMGLVDGHPHSLADTAAALGLGQSEAGEIEARAFEHIREVIPLDRLGKLLGN